MSLTSCNHFTYSKPLFKLAAIISKSVIDGCRQGRREDQQSVYTELKGKMFGLCMRYAHSREDAEDILHDGFIAVFRDIGQYKGEGPVEAWIRKVILNTALQHLRKQQKNIFHYQDPTELNSSDADHWNEQDHFDKEDMIKTMLSTMQTMPTGFRTVLNLYVIEGLSHDQIAQTLGISSGTSKSQLSRAKDYLRNALAKTLKVNG